MDDCASFSSFGVNGMASFSLFSLSPPSLLLPKNQPQEEKRKRQERRSQRRTCTGDENIELLLIEQAEKRRNGVDGV